MKFRSFIHLKNNIISSYTKWNYLNHNYTDVSIGFMVFHYIQ